MFDTFKCACRNLFRNKERTLLTLLSISIGVTSVIAVIYLGQSGSNTISSEMDSLGMGGIMIGLSDYSAQDTLSDTEVALIENQSSVECVAPLVFESTSASMYNTKQNVYLWGIDCNANETISLELINGRFFNQYDIHSESQVCMIDESLIETFSLENHNIIGRKIKIINGSTNLDYEIIGIIKTGKGLVQNIMGSYLPNFIYIPYTIMQSNLNNNNYSQIAVKLSDTVHTQELGNKIIKHLERNTGKNDVYVLTDMAQQKENLNFILNIITVILSAVGTISLIVAGISIMTIMLVSVNERKREIGIKKSIGANRHTIIKEFLYEAISVSIIGCILGIFFGFVISYFVTMIIGLNFQFQWSIIIYAVCGAVVFGTFFGLYPALKASALKPVDALRMN